MMNLALCPDSVPSFLGLFDLSIAPTLLFYAYIPAIIVALLFGLYIFIKDKRSLQSRLLLGISAVFSFWVLNLMFQWTVAYVNIDMFSWQITPFFEILIPILSLYFIYVFINKKDIPFSAKIIFSFFIAILAITIPTPFNTLSFDYQNCQANYGDVYYHFIYIFEFLSIFIAGFICMKRYVRTPKEDRPARKQALILGAGSVLFLFIFFLSNALGEYTKTYQFNLFGPIGILAFIGFLSFLIVRYGLFNVKMIATQALVFGIAVTMGAQLFSPSGTLDEIVTAATLVAFLIAGVFLIRSVKREVEQREKIEALAADLKASNEQLASANVRLHELDQQKSEFVSLASHQLRSPLTAIRGYVSLITEGEYGEVPAAINDPLLKISESIHSLVIMVEDFLNVSRIEQGRLKFEFADFDVAKLAEQVLTEMKPSIEKAGLIASFRADLSQAYITNGDQNKIKQVFTNFVDNSIKYTPNGSISMEVSKNKEGVIRVEISDTGVGIAPEVLPRLFSKFTRAPDANKTNVQGTGLGLYVARQMVEAHKGGRVWAESDGEGKGSRFYVELQGK